MSQKLFDINKSRVLVFMLYFTFLTLHLLAIAILRSNFSLAPDEQGYLNVFRNIYSRPFQAVQDDTGWDGASDLFLWVAYLPAKILSLIGLNDLVAIRVLSIGITLITVLVLVHSSGRFHSPRVHLMAILLFLIPSVFVWTSLGMREPFIFFFIGLFFWSLNRITGDKSRSTAFEVSVLAISSLGMLSTKNYLWAVLMICLLTISLWKIITKGISFKKLGLIFVSIILSISFYNLTTKSDALAFITSLNSSSLESVSTRLPILNTNPPLSGEEVITPSETNENGSIISSIKTFIFKTTGNKVDLNRESSVSDGKRYSTNFSAASPSDPLSFLGASLRFIVSPLVFSLDVPFFILIASVESLFWISLTLILLMRRSHKMYIRTCSSFTDALAIIVIIMFILMSAGVEINLGTAFRHRSILLIPMAFLLLSSGTKRTKPII
jgi:hypothetical protein